MMYPLVPIIGSRVIEFYIRLLPLILNKHDVFNMLVSTYKTHLNVIIDQTIRVAIDLIYVKLPFFVSY